MSSRECGEQLKRLIYDWETEGLLTKINTTDIEAIKHLMLENQVQHNAIADLKQRLAVVNEMNVANYNKYCEVLKENQQLKKDKKFYSNAFVNLRNRNDKAIEYIETATIDPQSMRHYRGCLLEILKGYNKEE